jgi:hypothetical protein
MQEELDRVSGVIPAHPPPTPRSSHDIRERELARTKQVHRILVMEFHTECSSEYKSHSRKRKQVTVGTLFVTESEHGRSIRSTGGWVATRAGQPWASAISRW